MSKPSQPYLHPVPQRPRPEQGEQANAEPIGVLLVGLGTPDDPSPAAVRRYLAEFLGDPRVVEIPRIFWWPILHGLLLPIRGRRSAAAYQRIWTEKGSPLLSNTRELSRKLDRYFEDKAPGSFRVEFAMRYGKPGIEPGLERLREAGAHRLLILPMFPQYSGPTVGSIFDAVTAHCRQWRWVPELRYITGYFDDAAYISTVAASIRAHRADHGQVEKLLFSFHSIPRRYHDKGDPHFAQGNETARLLARELDLGADAWAMGFQSRIGGGRWLEPRTMDILRQWGEAGIDHAQIVCPCFPVDCLETLDEIAVEGRREFIRAGGGNLECIPALNATDNHVEMLASIISKHASGWPRATAPSVELTRNVISLPVFLPTTH